MWRFCPNRAKELRLRRHLWSHHLHIYSLHPAGWRLIFTCLDLPDLLCNECFLLDTGDRWLLIMFRLERITCTVCVPQQEFMMPTSWTGSFKNPQWELTPRHAAGSKGRCLREAANNPECWRWVEPEAAAVTDWLLMNFYKEGCTAPTQLNSSLKG